MKAYDILAEVDEILGDDSRIMRIVFVGDICDEWHSGDDLMMREIEEFVDWVEERRALGLRIDVLLGNHDFQYLIRQEGPGTHMGMLDFVDSTLFMLEPQVACEVDGFLLTHAGLTQTFADEELDVPQDAADAARQLNDMLADGTYPVLQALFSCGIGRGGHGIPGPFWADKWELEEDPADGIPQIVGHMPVTTMCRAEMPGFNDDVPEIWFCDTFSLRSNMVPIGDGSMLLVDDGAVSVVHPQRRP